MQLQLGVGHIPDLDSSAAIDNNTIVVESNISYSLIIVIRESCTGVTERQ